MYENFPHGSLSIDFDDIITQAIQENRDVRLDHGDEYGYVVVIDGVALPTEKDGFARETFGYLIDDVTIDRGEATELVNELAEKIERQRTMSRNRIPSTESHSAAEGVAVTTESRDQ